MNPTEVVNLDFGAYAGARNQQFAEHQVNRVPDYAFSLDEKLRHQLTTIGPLRTVFKAVLGVVIEMQKQDYLSAGIRVGANQFPEIHALGVDCARRLGISIPELYISPEPTRNAFTIGVENAAPIIVITAELVRACTLDELRFIIGHECGHIHNNHSVYNTLVQMLTNPLAQAMVMRLWKAGIGIGYVRLASFVLTTAIQVFMARWSRCAEITCDRAGLLCCGQPEIGESALMKLITGGGALLDNVNFDAYAEQLSDLQSPGKRMRELLYSHPIIPRRIEAIRLFGDCDVYYKWRTDAPKHASVRAKTDVDADCERIIGVLTTGL